MKTKYILPTEMKVGDTIVRDDAEFKIKEIKTVRKFPNLLDMVMETGMEFSLPVFEEFMVVDDCIDGDAVMEQEWAEARAKEREALLAEVLPMLTEEGYADLTYLPIEELRKEVEEIKKFVPDPTIGM